MKQINTNVQLPDSLKPALLHAIDKHDKGMLNLIELALVKELKIIPSIAGDDDKWEPVGISEVGRDLVIKWEERGSCECDECGGSGELAASGRTHTYYMECPECDGTGKSEEAAEIDGVAYTDIDGAEIKSVPEELEFLAINGVDSLSQFNKAIVSGKVQP